METNRYNNGRIYKIVCGDLTYIGSTCQSLCKRLAKHKKDFKSWSDGKRTYTTSYKLFQAGTPQIYLIEAIKCENKEELLKRERFHIESIECVNKIVPGRTREEYKLDCCQKYKDTNHKYYEKIKDTKRKEYNELNKDKIILYKKEYYETNKEQLNSKGRVYYEQNKDAHKMIMREWREQNKETIKMNNAKKYTCECGSELCLNKKKRHKLTNKHINYINSN